jgi:G3E family GTPase
MKVVIIGGFLGSGKTTTILTLGRLLGESGERVSIIVNEIGEVGIDGDVIMRYGFETKELTNGCICCSLKRDMKYTIHQMREAYDPTYILIEPTGIAFPLQIKGEIARMNMDDVEFAPIVTLIDGTRFKQQMKETKNFSRRQITDAEVLCITKVDMMKPLYVPIIETSVKQMNPSAHCMTLSMVTGQGLDELIERLADESVDRADVILDQDSIGASGIATHARSYVVDAPKLDEKTATRYVADVLLHVQREVEELNPDFVGHVKLTLLHPDVSIRASITAAADEPSIGALDAGPSGEPSLKVLIAASNVPWESLAEIADEAVSKAGENHGIRTTHALHHGHRH